MAISPCLYDGATVRCRLTVLDGPSAFFKTLLQEVIATERLPFDRTIKGILEGLSVLKPVSGLVVVDVVGEHLPIGLANVLQNAGSAALTWFLSEHWSGESLSIGSTTC